MEKPTLKNIFLSAADGLNKLITPCKEKKTAIYPNVALAPDNYGWRNIPVFLCFSWLTEISFKSQHLILMCFSSFFKLLKNCRIQHLQCLRLCPSQRFEANIASLYLKFQTTKPLVFYSATVL